MVRRLKNSKKVMERKTDLNGSRLSTGHYLVEGLQRVIHFH